MSTPSKKLPPLFRIDTISEPCETNSLIITANQRLSNKAIQAWGHYQQEKSQTLWKSPRIYSIDKWFKHCWKKLQADGYNNSSHKIISNEQERIFWEQITSHHALMQTEVLAQQAASAYKALCKWKLTIDELKQYESDISSHLLQSWFTEFEKKLARTKLITLEESIKIIGQAYSDGALKQEPEILLVGFDDIPPLINSQLNNISSNIRHIDSDDFIPKTVVRREYKDFESELKAATHWARQILSNSDTNASPRIGIIVPNLGQCRSQIERALINTFEGHSLFTQTPRYTLPFNISAGVPLGKTPLFIDTFLLLKLNQSSWAIEDIYRLLFSPFWGAYSTELETRSSIVNDLQTLGLLTVSTQGLCWRIEQKIQQAISLKNTNTTIDDGDYKTYRYLKNISDKDRYEKNRQLPSQWVEIFLKQLDDINWPGERQPDSIEYQQTQLWHQLLETFASLDNTLGSISVSDAISQLKNMANYQPFQAKVPDSPIQVLGILEGSGLHFTHCWILGLHQQAWPPAPSPNPMLPIALQREHNMPHASSLRELQFAQSLTKNYKHCAKEIIFSSATYDTDNDIELSPSQLIQDIPIQDGFSDKQSEDFEGFITAQHQTKTHESVPCQQAPKVNIFDLNSEGILTGGSNIIKMQSINPFDAFAKHRLKIRSIPKATIGFSAIDKGNILHLSLASIWEQLRTQNTLLSTSEDKLKALVSDIVNAEMNTVIKHKRFHFGTQLCELEAQRQTQLILGWLAHEKSRQPFSVIAIEESHRVKINGYTLQLRLDRVDEINNTSDKPYQLLIDYKTGQCSLNDWKSERPTDPQLPFYLTINNSNHKLGQLNAIAFAQINIKKQSLVGLHHENNHFAELTPIEKNRIGLQPTWEHASEEWNRISNHLFEQFISGNAEVNYINNNQLNFSREYIPLNRFYDC